MNVFINAQIYLNFYSIKEEWKLFEQIINLKKEKKIELIFPQITYNEVIRNVYGGGKNDKFFKEDEKKIYSAIPITIDKKIIDYLGLDTKEMEKIFDELNEIKKAKLLKYIKSSLSYAGEYIKKINNSLPFSISLGFRNFISF